MTRLKENDDEIKSGILLMGVLLMLAFSAGAQTSGEEVPPKFWIGRWTGAAENALYSADAVVRIRPVSRESPTVTLTGSVTMRPKTGGTPTILSLKGEQTGSAPTGVLTYTDPMGLRTIELGGRTSTSNISYFISFSSGTFGPFEIRIFRTEDIVGVWLFEDGNPMTVTQKEDGSFEGTYKGTPASGHGGLSGILTGTLNNQLLWDGFITITEANVLVTGRFQLQYRLAEPLGPAFDETLEGTITASSNIDPIVRTNPITLVRGEE